MKGLELNNLSIATKDGKSIINNLSLVFKDEVNYALLGENGVGKSTLVNSLMGHPNYKITSGKILLDGKDITNIPTEDRAKMGLFLANQYSPDIQGLSYGDFLRLSMTSIKGNNFNFFEILSELEKEALSLGFKNFDYKRDLNAGFSGGEKKKSEILQMLILKPRFAFLDEPDSGLDHPSVIKLAYRLQKIDYPTSLIIISHHDYLLNKINPQVTYRLDKRVLA